MQLEVQALKLYDFMVYDLELTIRDVHGVVSLAGYIQGWRQSIWESSFFWKFKTWDGI